MLLNIDIDYIEYTDIDITDTAIEWLDNSHIGHWYWYRLMPLAALAEYFLRFIYWILTLAGLSADGWILNSWLIVYWY